MAKAARSPEREPDPDFSEETDRQTDAMGRPLLIDEQDEHVDPPVDEGAEQQRITERRARAQGWVPQDQYRGDSAKWVDAETFLEKGYGNNDILRERIDRLADRLAERDSQLGEMGNVLSQLNEKTTALHQRAVNSDRAGYERGVADAEARMRKAAAEADTEAYDEAKADLDALEAKPVVDRPASQPQPARPAQPPVDAVTQQWVRENSSWWSDNELSDATIVIHKRLMRDNPNMGQIEGYNTAKAEMMRRYPEKFENPRRAAPGSGGVRTPSGDRGMNGNGNGGGGRRSYENLPKEAKDACDMFVRTIPSVKDKETGKMRKYTRADYLDTYDGEFVR